MNECLPTLMELTFSIEVCDSGGRGVCVSVGVCVDDGWPKQPHLESNQTG